MAANDNLAIDALVIERLTSMSIDPATIDKRTFEHLAQIEEAIIAEAASYRAARAEARTHHINVSNISKVSKISRATFYNKPLLREYLNDSRKTCGVGDEEAELERLKKTIAEKDETIEAMTMRDAELVVLASENKRLRHKIENLERYISDPPSDIRTELEAWGLESFDPGITTFGDEALAKDKKLQFPEDE